MRRTTFAALAAALLVGAGMLGGAVAIATHSPDIVHVCEKNGKMEVVASPGDCKQGENAINLATEAAVTGSQTQIDQLETLAKRLVGNTAAVLDGGLSGTVTDTGTGHYIITIDFCESLATNCLTLQTEPIDETDAGTVITFDASNSTDFEAIAARLTNGVDNSIEISNDYFDSDSEFGGGGSSTALESARFFRNQQVSTGVGFVDLEGLEIGSIDLSLDIVSIFVSSGTVNHNLDYRIFFTLAD